MTYENLENIISLLCTIVGLLYCVFIYIRTPKRGYRCLIAFFLADFLSEYYWTIYELIMHAHPNVSEFVAYMGWNIGYFFLLLAILSMMRKGAKQFFHPVILLPVVVNIPQLLLYIRYGGMLNNIWEVSITTVTSILCLQNIMYYIKNKDKQRTLLLFSVFLLVYIMLNYGMWTASCFTWKKDLLNPYLYFSVISSFIKILLVFGAAKYYGADDRRNDANNASILKFQVLLQVIISIVIIGICAIGFFTAYVIKNSLLNENSLFSNESQLIIYLFIISVILILIILALLYALTTRYRRLIDKGRKISEGKRSRINFIFTIVVTLTLIAFNVIYNNVILYNASVISVYEDGKEEIKTTATELENYLTVAATTLRIEADSVDLLVQNGSTTKDVTKFIMDQTERQAEQFDENFTGLYAYINGEYLDGLGWEPPAGYDPTSRDWYKTAVAAKGDIVIVSPYVDAQTGSVVITIGKEISDTPNRGKRPFKNVVCMDVIVNHIKDITQKMEIAKKGYGMVINSDGFIIAHRNEELNGKDLTDVYDPELLENIKSTKNGRLTANLNDEDCTLFVSPVMGQWYSVMVVNDTELFEDTYLQLFINIMVSLITFCLITFFYYIGYKSEQFYGRRVEEMSINVVSALAAAIDAKDNYTNGHSSRVAEYARMIAARSGYSKEEQDEIYMMGLLHDIGKIGVPDEVINKPSKLTDEEFALIKKHPIIGSSILRSIKGRPKLATVARWHHERYSGGGYPDGIAGEMIPEEARIIAVADAYDAMTSRRSYRDIMPQDKVLAEIKNGSGTQFDPRFAEAMIKMIEEDTEYTMREKQNISTT